MRKKMVKKDQAKGSAETCTAGAGGQMELDQMKCFVCCTSTY